MGNFEINGNTENSEMFTHYGNAVWLAQKFEKGLAAFLQGEFAFENKGKLPYEKYHEEISKLYKSNLGELLRKLKKQTTVDSDIEELLQKALKRRNYLVHDYFYHNESKATVPDGRLSIVQELIEDQATFLKAIMWVDQRCKEGLLKIGVDAAKFAEIVEKNRLAEIAKFRNGVPIELLTK